MPGEGPRLGEDSGRYRAREEDFRKLPAVAEAAAPPGASAAPASRPHAEAQAACRSLAARRCSRALAGSRRMALPISIISCSAVARVRAGIQKCRAAQSGKLLGVGSSRVGWSRATSGTLKSSSGQMPPVARNSEICVCRGGRHGLAVAGIPAWRAR